MMKQKCSYVTPETSVVGVETESLLDNFSGNAGKSSIATTITLGETPTPAKKNNLWDDNSDDEGKNNSIELK
jgi:hypothetical protein